MDNQDADMGEIIQEHVEPMIAEIRRETSEDVQTFLTDTKAEIRAMLNALSKKQAEFERNINETADAQISRIQEASKQIQFDLSRGIGLGCHLYAEALEQIYSVCFRVALF